MVRRLFRVSVALGVAGVSALAVLGVGALEAGATSPLLEVGCGSGSFTTIGAAVSAATAHQSIKVCAGVYHESVVVPAGKPVAIVSPGGAVINAAGLASQGGFNGILVQASGTVVQGMTVTGAYGEGILVEGAPGKPITNVFIGNNTVRNNDRGNPTGAPITDSKYPECNAGPGDIPGDCGEGVHLMVAAHSTVQSNTITHNSGGVLVTDEFGPSHDNMILGNIITDNTLDCGVTLAGHNPNAFTGGMPMPTVAGVFNNTVESNRIDDNGVVGQGAGVVLATGTPGGAVYNNSVLTNTISGNGLAGVTLHSHAPGQDLNGNVVSGNTIGTNNLSGDTDFPPGDLSTTGILVATAVGPVTISVTNNVIQDNHFGIWFTPGVTLNTAQNQFINVAFPFHKAS
jgi:nitrous oxidase accessory protein NosD